jgi:hypothetical protein
MQEAIVTALTERATAAGITHSTGDPTLQAVTAAAFGCVNAAQQAWLESGSNGTFATALDKAMAAVASHARPRPSPSAKYRTRAVTGNGG